MISITDKSKCCGCSACKNACPQKCISMQADIEGFLYPVVNAEQCIRCGLCERVCPINSAAPNDTETKAFAAINSDESQRLASSSGGVFPLLAQKTLSEGGIVFGAAFDERMCLSHIGIDQDSELNRLLSSKYLQSDMRECYLQVKSALSDGRKVLFCGTPCQVAGLKCFLGGKESSNLLCVDLICHGVPSPKVWARYLGEISGGETATFVSFRDKKLGWSDFSMRINFLGGRVICEQASNNAYMKGFLSDLTLRPSCYACHFKTVSRVSDITLADYWNVRRLMPEMYDNKGCSLVITHSKAGEDALADMSDRAKIVSTDLATALSHNIAATASSAMNPKRDEFFEKFAQGNSVSETLQSMCRASTKQKLKSFIKRILRRLGRR